MAKGNGIKWNKPETILLRHPSSAAKLDEMEHLTEKNGEEQPEEDEEDLQHATYWRKFVILFKDKYTRKHFFISALLWYGLY